MPLTIYLDTSIVCYLTDPPSDNSITRACQQLTQLWWHTRCMPGQTCVSEYVIEEIREGDPLRAMRRIKAIEHLTKYPANRRVAKISELLVWGGGLRANARRVGEHVSSAMMNHCDVLLTWNCLDIANAEKFPLLRMLVGMTEYALPELVTPFEIMENSYENI